MEPLYRDDFVELLAREKALAVLRTDRAENASPAMDAAVRGGFRIIEFTLNTPGAFELIQDFSKWEGIVVGAGTVLTLADAEKALECGASFLVSPVVDEGVIAVANAAGRAAIPGTATPTEMLRAHHAGAPLQKLFPAPGPHYVRACLGPLPFLRIVPTNGVTAENAAEFIQAGSTAVGFVGPLFDPDEVRNGNFDGIEAKARDLLATVQQVGQS